MPPEPPWTNLGRLESEVSDIKRQLSDMARSHEVHAVAGRLRSVEYTLQEMRTELDGLCYRVQVLEESQIMPE